MTVACVFFVYNGKIIAPPPLERRRLSFLLVMSYNIIRKGLENPAEQVPFRA